MAGLRAVSGLVLGGLVGCTAVGDEPRDVQIVDPAGCLSSDVAKVELDLGDPAPVDADLVISNDCDGTVGIVDVRVTGDGFTLEPGLDSLEPGQAATLRVRFTPPHTGSFTGEVRVVLTPDPEDDVVIPLQALLAGGYLEITESGRPWPTPVGCERVRELQVSNSGNLPVTVSEATLVGAGFELVDFDGELVVGAGGTQALPIRYTATGEGTDEAVLTLITDEPLRGELTHELDQVAEYRNPQDVSGTVASSPVDVLLTIDRSACNTEHHETVPEAIQTFRSAMADWDYRVTIVTADSGCILGEDPFIDASMSAAAASKAAAAMIDMDFELSPYGANTERGFTLAEGALSPDNAGERGCNAGTFRDDAFLHIIHQSDEPEQSPREWSWYTDAFRNLKDGRVMQHGVVAPPEGCVSAAPGYGYHEAIAETGGLERNICETVDGWIPAWDAHFSAFADHMQDSVMPRIELPAPPLPGEPIVVSVNGTAQTDGWTYDAEAQWIVFELGRFAQGAEVRVTYQAVPEACP